MIFVILLVGLLIRWALSPLGTYWGDMNSWIGWGNRLLEVGFKDFYNSWCDYLPGYLYLLWLLAKIKALGLSIHLDIPNVWLYKMPSMLADLGTSYLIYKIINRFRSQLMAVLAAGIYLFNPAIWANSALWGQADGFFTFVIFLSFYLLISKKYLFSAIIFGFACIIKPLALFLWPLILLFLFLKKEYRYILWHLILASTIIIVSFIPFANANLVEFIFSRFMVTLNQYPHTSLNAFNFWGFILPFWTKDQTILSGLSYQYWGIVLFGTTYLLITLNFVKKIRLAHQEKKAIYLLFYSAGLIFFSNFLFLTRMHERHLLPAFAFLTIAVIFKPLLSLVYLSGSLIYLLNLRYAFVNLTDNFKMIFSQPIVKLLSGLQILNLISLLFIFNKQPISQDRRFNLKKSWLWQMFHSFVVASKEKSFPKTKQVKVKHINWYLVFILLLAFGLRIWNIWHPRAYIFDEVYHGFTAQEMAKGDIKAWEWWNNPPEGFAYEWTHPPLAKVIMAGSVLLFGHNDKLSQYAFRVPGVFFGIGAIYLTYLLTKEIFKNERLALLAAFLFSLDGLAFVMSRVGMVDIYALFFLLLTIYLVLVKKYFWSAISLGLAIGTKWTGVYLYPIVGLILLAQSFTRSNQHKKQIFNFQFFRQRRTSLGLAIFSKILIFTIIPPLVYILCNLSFFLTGHSWSQFIDLQRQMWWYHTSLKATHAYQSAAWTWPFLIRPVWFWVDYKPQTIANIYNLGNPLIWWSGLLVIPLAVYQAIEDIFSKKNYRLGVVILCYFAFWLPWVFSPRIMFLHHYLPAIPFLCFLLAYFLDKIYDLRLKIYEWKISGKLLITAYLLLITTSFIFFFPIYTGISVPKELVKYFFWLPTWK
jgi:Gpi18-like mannosyltransferase